MAKKKILFVMPDYGSCRWESDYFHFRNAHSDFKKVFNEIRYFPEYELADDVSCLFLEGGTDIDPERYGQKRGTWTQFPNYTRDHVEFQAYKKAVLMQIPVMGICRGAQLMCVANGGSMIQEVSGHHRNHLISTPKWGTFEGNCSHHQMMFPYSISDKTEYEILAWATTPYSKYYVGEKDKKVKLPKNFKEIEALWFPKTKSLGIQGHPEYVKSNHPFAEWCYVMFETYILPKIGK